MKAATIWRSWLAGNFLPILAVCAAAAAILQFVSEEKFRRDPIVLIRATLKADNWNTDNEKRFSEMKPLLPSLGTIGYINGEEGRGYEMVDKGRYYQTQYALAPLGVDGRQYREPSQFEFVVGNFSSPADAEKIARARGLSVVQDFGNGVVLFRSLKNANPGDNNPRQDNP